MIARPYAASDRARWNELVRASRVGHFMHQREYMEYHSDRFADASLVVEDDNGKTVALLPASLHGDEVVSHGGLTFGGVLTTDKVGTNRMLRIFAAILQRYLDDGITNLRYKPAPHIYHNVPAEEDLYAVWRAGGTLARRGISSSLLLQQRSPYSKGRKAALKQVPSELTLQASTDYATFVEIESAVLTRHGVTIVHTAEELELLGERFPENISLYLALYEGVPVAGMLLFDSNTVRHTQYLGATPRGKDVGAVDALIDFAIHGAVDRFRWFDFGISSEQQDRLLNAGLVSQKESFGARAVNYDHYDIPVTEAAVRALHPSDDAPAPVKGERYVY